MAIKADTKKEADDYANLINLMSVLAEASTRKEQLGSEIQSDYLELVDEHKPLYASLQATIMQIEEALELVARTHPEWFADAKTIKTPFGTVSFRTTTRLEVPNPELTIVLLEQQLAAEIKAGKEEAAASEYLRQTTTLNLEALEKLDDAALARLRIQRVKEDSFSAKPLKLDLGKAVKAAAEKAGKAVTA